MLWSGKWIILGVLILSIAGTALYTYTIPTKYRTSSLVLLDLQSSSLASSLGQSSFMRQSRSLQNELLVLRQSGTVAQNVAERLLEMKTHPQTGRPLQIIRGTGGRLLSEQQVAGRVQGAVRAYTAQQETDAIRISATSLDAYEASLIANAYADAYVERTREKSRESLTASVEFLESQAATLKDQVQSAEADIETYMREQGAVALDQETNRVVNQLSSLESRRDELRIELRMAESVLETQKEKLAEIEPQLPERISSSVQQKLSRVQQEKAELEAQIEQFTATNPNPSDALQQSLRRKKDRVAVLTQRADSLAQVYVRQSLSAGGISAGSGEGDTGGRGISYVAEQRRQIAQKQIEVDGLEARLDVVNNRIDELRQSMRNLPSQSIEMAQLQRERRSSERIYSFVREKLQERRMALQSEVGYAERLNMAGPGYPIAPDMQRNLILAAIFGFLLGGGLVVLRDRLDTNLHQPDDLRDHGHRLAGVVPSMDRLIEADFGGADTVDIDGHAIRTTLVMLTCPMSAVAESYRRIRTNLQFARPDKPVQTLAVSSADKGEGKSTTSANLACALASAGKRTVLVDADLRRPRLHEMFDLDRSPGLSEILYDKPNDFSRFATPVDGLSVIPGGETPPNPAELMGSKRMADLADRLRDDFDYVIFDTPPVLLFSDALGLSSQCDGTLLVATSDKTDGRAFDHAVELLNDVEADVLGAVLNRYEASSFLSSYDHYNYGYAHSYKRLEEHYTGADTASSGLERVRMWFNRS
jgi:capsular exopolysaccharide synthesis family protein